MGTGSAAVIILPFDTEVKAMEFVEVIPKITDNIEVEITAMAVAWKPHHNFTVPYKLAANRKTLSSSQTVYQPLTC